VGVAAQAVIAGSSAARAAMGPAPAVRGRAGEGLMGDRGNEAEQFPINRHRRRMKFAMRSPG